MEKRKILINSRKNYNSALERYRNKRKKEITVMIFIITTILLFFIFFNSSLVNIKKINILGLIQVDRNELIETTGLNQENKIWKINEDELEKKIRDNYNIIADVNVKKQFINTLNIEIKEKQLLVQEKKNDQYIKLLDDGQEYTGKVIQNYNLPIIDNFQNDSIEKAEVLKSLSELNKDVLSEISEISLDRNNKKTANIYMKDGQRIKVNLVNFSSKLNYYPQIEKFITDKRTTVLNLVNGTYLETASSEKDKVEKINSLLNNYIDNNIEKQLETTTT